MKNLIINTATIAGLVLTFANYGCTIRHRNYARPYGVRHYRYENRDERHYDRYPSYEHPRRF